MWKFQIFLNIFLGFLLMIFVRIWWISCELFWRKKIWGSRTGTTWRMGTCWGPFSECCAEKCCKKMWLRNVSQNVLHYIWEIIIVFMIIIAIRSYIYYAGWADVHANRKCAIFKINVVFMMVIVVLAECTSFLFIWFSWIIFVRNALNFPRVIWKKLIQFC